MRTIHEKTRTTSPAMATESCEEEGMMYVGHWWRITGQEEPQTQRCCIADSRHGGCYTHVTNLKA